MPDQHDGSIRLSREPSDEGKALEAVGHLDTSYITAVTIAVPFWVQSGVF
jgi:hypothetical protein